MSRLFPERVAVVLAPSEIAIGDKTLASDPAFGPDPWQGAVNALRAHEFKQRCRVTVILSNHLVRYALVPWNEALSGAAEEEAYVRHHFRKIHGERAKDWTVRASEAPRRAPRLASAIDTKLLEELKRSFPKGKAKLVSVQPRLMFPRTIAG